MGAVQGQGPDLVNYFTLKGMTTLAVKSLPYMLFGKSPNNQFVQMN